jgi:hypothetical protein
MSFLAEHCWKGTFADGKKTDEHCFKWIHDGHALRDTHVVHTWGALDFDGDTTSYVDSTGQHVEFLYIESSGGVSRGSVESTPGALVFPDEHYALQGETLVYRARWPRQGNGAYEAWSEAQTPNGWATMFRLVMHRID